MATFLAVVNASLGAGLALYSFRVWRAARHNPESWLRLCLAGMGVYICGMYLYVLVGPAIKDSVWFGRVFVRPLMTLLLGLQLSLAIYAMRRLS